MAQLTLTTFAGTVFSCLQIYSTNYFFECVWFCVPLKNARDDSAKIFIFRLVKTPLRMTLSKFRNLFFKNGQDNRHDLKSGLKNIRKFEGGLGAPQSA